jgi:hypothetical protein
VFAGILSEKPETLYHKMVSFAPWQDVGGRHTLYAGNRPEKSETPLPKGGVEGRHTSFA